MADRPSRRDVERAHAGEGDEALYARIEADPEARAYRDALRSEQARFLAERPDGATFARAIAHAAAETQEDAERQPSRWLRWLPLPLIALLATVVIVVVATSGTTEPTTGPDMRLKGRPELAIIVLRDGVQTRHVSDVTLRPGDRVRIELVVDEAGSYTVGQLDAGRWTAWIDGRTLAPGTSFLEQGFVVDAEPMDLRLIAGPRDAVAAAVASDRWDAVASLRVRSEAP